MPSCRSAPEVGANDIPLCPDCVSASGLCASHAKGVLPRLAQPHWYRLVGDSYHDVRKDESAAGAKARRRTERKLARQGKGHVGLALAIGRAA
jgi:hypothetical protein